MAESKQQTSPLARAVFALEKLNKKVAELEREKREPVAVVGMGCRFPGGSEDPEKYWSFLEAGGDGVIRIPKDRWNADAYYHPPGDRPTPGKMYLREGGFLSNHDIQGFETDFFKISPIEAEALDPQQRLLLEITWEALEDAGARPDQLSRSRTGVFLGIMNPEYLVLQNQLLNPEQYNAYSGSGSAFSTAGGRLSFFLGLQGPNYSIDEACGSSLASVHLAIQSLRLGECDMAIAGGVNLFLVPDSFIVRCQANMLAPDGRCKTFDASANGYGPGEGCGMLVLKRLSDAKRNGDQIYAVLRGSMVNHDGPASGLTVPNGVSQQQLMRDALANAGLQPHEIDYIECHGTGTPLGDPIEVGAIQAVYGRARLKADATQPMIMGSAKSNFGHLESAAGIAGLIKAILSVRHGKIPPNVNFKNLNPQISIDGTGTQIADRPLPWPDQDHPRRAAVSSFGFSGTNAHIIVEQPPEPAHASEKGSNAPVLILSARSPESLQMTAGRWADWITKQAEEDLTDICYTAARKRARLAKRLAIPARSLDEVRRQMLEIAKGELPPYASLGDVLADPGPGAAFVYSGQGSQWSGMGQELLEREPRFRAKIEEIDALLGEFTGWSLLDELQADESKSRLDQTAIAQPAIFAIQIALTELWASRGVRPAAVVGHSVGEVAAAHVAGKLSLGDATRVIYHRSRLMQAATGLGRMAAANLSFERAKELIAGKEDRLAIAAINGPESIVFSGEGSALEETLASLGEDVFTKILPVDYAFHSPQMEPFKQELVEALTNLPVTDAELPIYSTVSGAASGKGQYDAAYWGENVRGAVYFAPAIENMIHAGFRVFLEIGPHPVLQQPVQQSLEKAGVAGASAFSLRRGSEEEASLLANLGALFVAGLEPDWETVFPAGRTRSLPPYQWKRDRYWLPVPESGRRPRTQALSAPQNDLDNWLYETTWVETEEAQGPPAPADWVIFADESGVGYALKDICAREGANCILVTPASEFGSIHSEHYQLRPGNLEDIQEFARVALTPRRNRPTRILHLWTLDDPAPDTFTVESLEAAQENGILTALHMVQAGHGVEWTEAPRIWFVTRGANPHELSGSPNPAPHTLWGFARTMAVEHAANWGGAIDLDPADDSAASAAHIFREALHSDGEDQILRRGGKRFVARLVPQTPAEGGPSIELKEDSSYLVTGGLTGIGLLFANWLADRGAKHIILLGRTPLPDRSEWDGDLDPRVRERVDAVRSLEAKGAAVVASSVDSADEKAFRSFLHKLQDKDYPPIRGVIHSAGVLEGQTILQLSRREMEKVLRPKVAGGWVLHRAFDDDSLDFLVLFSSVSGVVTGMGEAVANYAAANAFLDGLAHYRRSRGQAALSIAWGPWADIGFAAQTDTGKRMVENLASKGIFSITSDLGLAVLENLLQVDKAQSTVIRINWPIFERSFPVASRSPSFRMMSAGGESLLSDPSAFNATTTAGPEPEESLTREKLLEAEVEERPGLVENYLVQNLAAIMRSSPDRLSADRSLQELGMDSLMAVEIRNRVERDLGLELSAAKLVDGSTTAQIATLLSERIAAEDTGREGAFIEAPATDEQLGFWYLKELLPDSPAYVNSVALRLHAALDSQLLFQAIEELTKRRETLRSAFLDKAGAPRRIVRDEARVDFEQYEPHEIEGLEEDNILELIQEELLIPFELNKGPLFRVRLFSISPELHILLVFAHRTILDPTNLRKFIHWILSYYGALESGNQPEAKVESDFSEYARHQAELLQGPEGKKLEDYWSRTLAGELPMFHPPSDRARPPEQSMEAGSVIFSLDSQLQGNLEKYVESVGAPTEDALLAVSFAMLRRLTGQPEVILGVPLEPKNAADFQDALGPFENFLPIRVKMEQDPSFNELCQIVCRLREEANEHSAMPFPRLVRLLKPPRDPARPPVFQAIFEAEAFRVGEMSAFDSTLKAESYFIPANRTTCDLKIRFKKGENGITGEFVYNRDIFEAETIELWAGFLQAMLKQAIGAPDKAINGLALPQDLHSDPPIDRGHAGTHANRFVSDILEIDHLRTLPGVFDEVARRIPGAFAVFTGDHLEHGMTYGELNARANQLAREMADRNLQPGDVIAISMWRSSDYLVGLLAALKSGGTTLSLDPAYSITRLNIFLNDAKPRFLITNSRVLERLSENDAEIINIEEYDFSKTGSIASPPAPPPETPAFLFYSQPDQVRHEPRVINHASAMNSIRWLVESSSLAVGSVTAWHFSASSPASIQEIFATLCSGGTLAGLPRRALADIPLIRFLKTHEVDRIFVNQSLLRSIADIAAEQDFAPTYLRELTAVGDRFFITENTVLLLREKLRDCSIHYHFGMTNRLILTSYTLDEERLREEEWPGFLPLGKPAPGIQIRVLDSNLNPVPLGAPGELCVLEDDSGEDGAINTGDSETNSEISAESFQKTGLLVRAKSDGYLHLLGLASQQMSLGGLPVNVKEIEAFLEEHPAIQECYVEKNPEIGGNGLLAYIVSDRIVDRLTVPIKCKVRHTAINDAGKEEEIVRVLLTQDLSPNGLSLQGIPDSFKPRDIVQLDILLPGLSELSIRGRIAWVQRGKAGVKFEPEFGSDSEDSLLMTRYTAELRRSLSYVLEMEQLSVSAGSGTDLRIPMRRPCTVTADRKRLSLTTSEISLTGISLSDAPEDWQPGKQVAIAVNLARHVINLQCTLAWREKSRTGFNINSSESELDELQKYLKHYTEKEHLSIAQLRSYLKEFMPPFMIPAFFVILEYIPRLPDGEINRSKLRLPIRKWFQSEISNTAPRTSIEGLLAGLWSELLGTEYESIGINDNFFEIGGHSLLAVALIRRIREEFNTALPIQSLYKAPTVADLASEIIQKKSMKGSSAEIQEAIRQIDSLSREDLKEIVLTQLAGEEDV